MTEPTPKLDATQRNRLTRYLHTGYEVPKYFPGCWTSHKYYQVDRLTILDEALANGMKNVEVINIILKAYKDGWYTRFETIAFALSKCLLLGSTPVKEAAYKAAAEICRTPEQMLMFNNFTRLLKTGNGRGWCKFVKDWYSQKEPMELAKEMSRVKARHGRSHKTIIRKAHIKIDATDYARDAVIKYAMFGLKRAKQLLGDKQEAKEILNYIQKVEDLRHCEDPVAAASIAADNRFSLEHVPGHLLTSQDVWNAIIPQLTLEDILLNIQRIHNMGHLTNDSTTTTLMVSLLNNKDIIKKSKVTPLMAYITLCNYKKKSKPLKHEKTKVAAVKELRRRSRQVYNESTGMWEWMTTSRRHPKEIKHWGIDQPPCPAVVAALSKLIDQTWLLTPPTKARYMITLDMRHHMFKGRHFCKSYVVPKKGKKLVAAAKPTPPTGGGDADAVKKSKKHLFAESFYNKHVTPGHAAIITALQILKREKNVKLAVFADEGIQIVTIERQFGTIEEAEFVLRNSNVGRVQMDAPIEWAANNNHKVDVFINMVDRPTRFTELEQSQRGGRGPGGRYGPAPEDQGVVDHCPVRALERYRQKGVRDAKLIVMSLASHRVGTTDGSHEGVLDIVGVDEHVPRVIDAFTLGQFK